MADSTEARTPLVTLLLEAFPKHLSFPWDCWVNEAIEANQVDFGDVIDIITGQRGRGDLIRRMREEHPQKGHLPEHDFGLLNFFTEALAFAWAVAVDELPEPRFVPADGAPDLQAGQSWIEAKTVNLSDSERAERERLRPQLRAGRIVMRGAVAASSPAPGLVSKFQYHLDDALRKWERQAFTGRLIVFFNWTGIDFGTSRPGARDEVLQWATEAERSTPASIIICESWEWQKPLYSRGTINREN